MLCHCYCYCFLVGGFGLKCQRPTAIRFSLFPCRIPQQLLKISHCYLFLQSTDYLFLITAVKKVCSYSTGNNFFRMFIPHPISSFPLYLSYFYLLPSKTCHYRRTTLSLATCSFISTFSVSSALI